MKAGGLVAIPDISVWSLQVLAFLKRIPFEVSFLFFVWVFCPHVCICTPCMPGTHREVRKGIGYPGTGVMDACEPPHVWVGAGNWTRVLNWTNGLHCWASLQPQVLFLTGNSEAISGNLRLGKRIQLNKTTITWMSWHKKKKRISRSKFLMKLKAILT